MEEYKTKLPSLPISKCKKIAKTDPESMITSQSAYAATAFATELFIQLLAEEACSMAQINRATSTLRLSYDDLSRVIKRQDKFQFLGDIVPETENLGSLVKENKVRYTIVNPSPEIEMNSDDEEIDEDELGKDKANVENGNLND